MTWQGGKKGSKGERKTTQVTKNDKHNIQNSSMIILYSLQPKMEKLYTVNKKKDRKLTVAQIMNSLLPNLDFN